MISYKHKFIFIHVPKNAGTSVRRAIRPELRTPMQRLRDALGRPFGSMPYHHSRYPPHSKAQEYERALGAQTFASFRKFAVVRNPWDWHVSLFAYMQQTPNHYQFELVKDFSFDDYVQWRCDEDPTHQMLYLLDSSGANCVTDLARFESLSEDFNTFMHSVGIEARLPHRNKSNHRPYQEYYSDKNVEMIAKISQPDIDAFGYQF